MVVDRDARSKQSVVGVTAPDHHCTGLCSEPIQFLRGNALLDLTTDLLRDDRGVYVVESLGEFLDARENLVERDLFAFSVALCYEHYHYEHTIPKCDVIYCEMSIMSQGSEASDPPTINNYLDTAVQDSKIEEARALLAGGADANFIGASGVTLLNFAVWNQDVNMVKLLLENGANVHARNEGGRTGDGEDMFTPLQTVFTRRYGNGSELNRNKAKHILFVLIYFGNALSTTPIERFIGENEENLGWVNTTPQEIQEWVGDAAATRRGPAVAAMMRSAGLLGGKRRKTLRRKRIHKKRKTQRRLRRVRR